MIKCKIKREWVRLESEHTDNPLFAKKIVNDHLREYGCRYYPALIRMEKKLKHNPIMGTNHYKHKGGRN